MHLLAYFQSVSRHLHASKPWQRQCLTVLSLRGCMWVPIVTDAVCDAGRNWSQRWVSWNVTILPDWCYFGPFRARMVLPWAGFHKSLLHGRCGLLWKSKGACNLLGRPPCLRNSKSISSLGIRLMRNNGSECGKWCSCSHQRTSLTLIRKSPCIIHLWKIHIWPQSPIVGQ